MRRCCWIFQARQSDLKRRKSVPENLTHRNCLAYAGWMILNLPLVVVAFFASSHIAHAEVRFSTLRELQETVSTVVGGSPTRDVVLYFLVGQDSNGARCGVEIRRSDLNAVSPSVGFTVHQFSSDEKLTFRQPALIPSVTVGRRGSAFKAVVENPRPTASDRDTHVLKARMDSATSQGLRHLRGVTVERDEVITILNRRTHRESTCRQLRSVLKLDQAMGDELARAALRAYQETRHARRFEEASHLNSCSLVRADRLSCAFGLSPSRGDGDEPKITAVFKIARGQVGELVSLESVSYTHLTLPTNREV